MFPQYLQYLLTDFRQTFATGASWDTDDLITFWGQKVKVQGHTVAAEAHSTTIECNFFLFVLTLSDINWFSKYLHWHTVQEICNNVNIIMWSLKIHHTLYVPLHYLLLLIQLILAYLLIEKWRKGIRGKLASWYRSFGRPIIKKLLTVVHSFVYWTIDEF